MLAMALLYSLVLGALGRLCHSVGFANVIVAVAVTVVLCFGMSDALYRCFTASLNQVVLFGSNFRG